MPNFDIPDSIDWNLIRTLESKYGLNFERTVVWGLRWQKVLWSLPLAFFIGIALTCGVVSYEPIKHPLDMIRWLGVALVWTLMSSSALLVLNHIFEMSDRVGRIARSALLRTSNRYQFWTEIKLMMTTARWDDALAKLK